MPIKVEQIRSNNLPWVCWYFVWSECLRWLRTLILLTCRTLVNHFVDVCIRAGPEDTTSRAQFHISAHWCPAWICCSISCCVLRGMTIRSPFSSIPFSTESSSLYDQYCRSCVGISFIESGQPSTMNSRRVDRSLIDGLLLQLTELVRAELHKSHLYVKVDGLRSIAWYPRRSIRDKHVSHWTILDSHVVALDAQQHALQSWWSWCEIFEANHL